MKLPKQPLRLWLEDIVAVACIFAMIPVFLILAMALQ